MTDKVQKIREEVERLKLCTMDEHMKFYSECAEAEYNALCKVEEIIDSLQEEPVSEELEEAADEYAPDFSNSIASKAAVDAVRDAFKAGAKWQEAKDKQVINEEDVVVLPEEAFERMKRSLIELAEKEQMMANAIDVTVHIDSGGYPYIPQMELYDYDKDVPLAKEGDKYKVILIKED